MGEQPASCQLLSPTTLAGGPSLENYAPSKGSRLALTLLGGEIQARLSKHLGDP